MSINLSNTTSQSLLLGDTNRTSTINVTDTDINALYQLLENNKREIYYLDLYRIQGYVEDSTEIESAFSNLNINESVGIGANSITFLGINYTKGDILFKKSNGEPMKIAAPSSGMYYPNINGSNVTWTYSLYNSPISSDPNSLENPKYTYTYTPNTENSNCYNHLFTKTNNSFGTISFAKVTIDNINIKPIIRFYKTNNGVDEEVFCDYNLSLDGDNYLILISNNPATYIDFIQVK